MSALFAEYRARWAERYGHPYADWIGSRQAEMAADLVRGVPLPELVGAIRQFMADDDPWIRERRHPVNYFLKYPTKFIGRKLAQDKSDGGSKEEKARKAERARKELEAFERTLGEQRAGDGR